MELRNKTRRNRERKGRGVEEGRQNKDAGKLLGRQEKRSKVVRQRRKGKQKEKIGMGRCNRRKQTMK